MIKIKSLTLRNFLSIGNVSQSIKFEEGEIFLILGENMDLGGNDNRNGVGKTAIVNGLSYGLYGKPLVSIKLENLINKTNGKGMYVTVDFESDGTAYRVERGRKPNVFKFFKNDSEVELNSENDEAQGENRMTQAEIEKILGMSHDMFKNLVALTTYTEPFLSMRVSDQRAIIEQLLGITKLSEKAEMLKAANKEIKDQILKEEFRIGAVKEANRRIEDNIASLVRRSNIWESKHAENIRNLEEAISALEHLDIDLEISSHKMNVEIKDRNAKLQNLKSKIRDLLDRKKSKERNLALIEKNINTTHTNECHVCGSELGLEKHQSIINDLEKDRQAIVEELSQLESDLEMLQTEISGTEVVELINTFYKSIDEAYEHKQSIDGLIKDLDKERQMENPYVENIESLTDEGLQDIDYTEINDLSKKRDHQEFLLKLLTNKDSFIRKKIINQNLAYLNKRLETYLDKISLPHRVQFLPDLSVSITEHGRDLDFDNLSRGERTRLILSLSWAFRDVFESLNHKFNILYIDELIDNGLDPSGVESALGILKRMARDDNRCIHLISHREELSGRVDNIIKVVKESGFTTIEVEEN